MAKRAPHAKKSAKPRRRSNAEGLIELLREIGPQPEMADAIEEVYRETHPEYSSCKRGQYTRRRSTRTS